MICSVLLSQNKIIGFKYLLFSFVFFSFLYASHIAWADYQADYQKALDLHNRGKYTEAATLFAKSANAGNHHAQYSLGIMFRRGQGVEKDLAKSAYLLTESANKGLVGAIFEVALGKINGQNGFPKDRTEGIRLMRLAAEAKNISAMKAMWEIHSQNQFPEYDLLQAQKWLTLAAESDDIESMVLLADSLVKGKLGSIDNHNAAQWFLKAAKRGDTEAQYALGFLYNEGNFGKRYDINEGFVADHVSAFKWFKEAANRDHPKAQFMASLLAFEGLDGPKGRDQAVIWLMRGAPKFEKGSSVRLDMLKLLEELKTVFGDQKFRALQLASQRFKPIPEGTPVTD